MRTRRPASACSNRAMSSIGAWNRSSRSHSTAVDITLKASPRRTRGQAVVTTASRKARICAWLSTPRTVNRPFATR